MKHAYQSLSEDAVELLERDESQRETFLDLLLVLQDIVADVIPVPESPVYSEEQQREKAKGLSESLTYHAHLRETALANRENAFALREAGEAEEYLNALLEEYNQLRTLWNRGGMQALSP
jgi:hypothetical protein